MEDVIFKKRKTVNAVKEIVQLKWRWKVMLQGTINLNVRRQKGRVGRFKSNDMISFIITNMSLHKKMLISVKVLTSDYKLKLQYEIKNNQI